MRQKFVGWLLSFVLLFGASVVLLPGKPASAAGNGFSDTFSGGSGNWNALSGSWSVSGDEYVQSSTASGTYWSAIKGKRWENATYEFDVKLLNNGGSNLSWSGFQFKKMSQNDGPFDSGFLLDIKANGTLELYKVNKALASSATGINFSTARHVKIVNNAHNIKVYVNNETTPRIDYTDTTFASGYAGFAANTSSWSFDNVSITGSDPAYTINVGDPELLYTDAQMQITMDSSFATYRENSSTIHYKHGPFQQYFKGPWDNPLQTYVTPGGDSIDENGHDAGWAIYHIWIMNYYEIAPGELIGFTHNEKWPASQPTGLPYFSLGVVYSNNGGASWEYCGEILKPKNERLNVGGVPYVISGSDIYVYYNDGIYGELDGMGYPRHVAVAKANLNDVVNAARNNQNATWSKYASGSWSGNAMTGLGSAVMDNTYIREDTHSDAVYNSAINKYLMTIQTHESSKLNLYSSSDGLTWSMEANLDVAAAGSVMQPYSTFVDYVGGTNDGREVDGEFAIIYPRKNWNNYSDDTLYQRQITITTNATDKYSASGGFAQTQGTNQWSYEQWDGTTYSNMSWDSANRRWKGSQNNVIVGGGWQHPDTNDSVRTWTAPKAGTVNVSGIARKADHAAGGDGVNVKILKNGTQIWPASGWQAIGGSDLNGFSHNLTVSIAQNDKIRFIVNKGGTITSDSTHWDPTIEYDAYSASGGFGATQGLNQWSYKQWSGSAYGDMTWDAGNNRWQGSQTYVLIKSNLQHPDTGYDSARAWKAPKAGKIQITGVAKKEPAGGGDGVNVKIMKNGTQVWPSSGWKPIGAYDFTGVSHNVTISVATNDVIYFVVNRNSTITADGTIWDPAIRYTGL